MDNWWEDHCRGFHLQLKDFYELIFSSFLEEVIELGESVIRDAENTMLTRVPNMEEINMAVWNLHPFKSSGLTVTRAFSTEPTGEQSMKESMVFVKEWFKLQAIPHAINCTFVVLIPKINGPSNVNHYRLINLCNFVYKIVSKILATHLNLEMHKIIADNQCAFIKDRWIAENSILT